MTEKERVKAFDFYDKDRVNPVMIKVGIVKKNHSFNIKQVTYKITKVFKKDSERCVELRMTMYKLANTIVTHVHKCPAKKNQLKRMTKENKKVLVKKYGQKNVDAWEKGRVKMKVALSSVCPDCDVIFWKDKHVDSPTVDIVSTKGKKKLKARK